jgi:low temperature requirement protein LtrA
VLAAADAYSYLHLVIVAGIIVFAVGAKLDIAGTGPGGLALCGGVATYLIGQEAFAWRMLGTVEPWRLAAAVLLLALCPVADQLPGWVVAAIVAALLSGLCVKRFTARR